ncbi:hypothetical protein DXG01_000745 [Tephrocybe rancida]|nr:hypothetical protein DXG01_000745 [Tephrocybe rancida]
MSSISSSSRPSSPTKPGSVLSDVFKPNPHPYAIKTTSTGILSRSSSTSSSAFQSHNHYVPVSPSPSPTRAHHSGFSERGSRHRYSRSLTDENSPRPLPPPPEDLHYQQQEPHGRPRAESFSGAPDDTLSPKTWTFEQLAANVPEIADFVQEHEITGRAFLRFDDGVLDAYGVTEQWQRSLILSHSRRLRQSMLQNRIWPNSNPLSDRDAPNGHLSHSRSISPTKSREHAQPDEEDDPAYLSSSSSISSTSSLTGRSRRRYRPNGRVHGMVASFERSASPDKADFVRSRSGSISSVEDNDGYPFQPQFTGDAYGRPLPLPPQPTGEYVTGPLLLPQTSFPNSFPPALNTHQSTGYGLHATPQVTGNGNFLDHNTPQPTGNNSRPLPATPLHPSLRPPPILDDGDDGIADKPAMASKNTSGEMTMDELISVLNPDSNPSEPRNFVNTDGRRGRDKVDKRKHKGAAAWEAEVGDTVKHIPPVPMTTTTPAQSPPPPADDEMTMEELLAREGGPGAAAWVDEPEGVGRTMKRVEVDKPDNARFGSISKGRSLGKTAERISLSAGRKSHGPGKKQARRVGELFTPAAGVEEQRDEEQRIRAQVEMAEEMELERMREIERELLRAEEEERVRWVQHAEEEAADLRRQEDIRAEEAELRRQEELQAEEERVRKVNEERLRELFQRQQLMQEETRRRAAEEVAAKERQAREEAAAEQRRQEEVEQRLASSVEENRRLLEEFRKRLEQIEQRVEELHTTSSKSSTSAEDIPPIAVTEEDAHACLKRRLRLMAAWALSSPFGAVLPAVIGLPLANFARTYNPQEEDEDEAETRRGKVRKVAAVYPRTLSRYALLFGIGMCAFMLRGLMRWGVKGVRGMGAVGARGVSNGVPSRHDFTAFVHVDIHSFLSLSLSPIHLMELDSKSDDSRSDNSELDDSDSDDSESDDPESATFNFPDANVVFRSSDGVLFHIHTANLDFASDGFPPTSIKSQHKEIVQLPEDETTLDLLFRFVYPRILPNLKVLEFDTLARLAEAVEKYQVHMGMKLCNIFMAQQATSHPLKVLDYALKHNYPSIANSAAPRVKLSHLASNGGAADIPYYNQWMEAVRSNTARRTSMEVHTRDNSPEVCNQWPNLQKKILAAMMSATSPDWMIYKLISVPKATPCCEAEVTKWRDELREKLQEHFVPFVKL